MEGRGGRKGGKEGMGMWEKVFESWSLMWA